MLFSVSLFAASATASNRWWPSDHTDSIRTECQDIAGVYAISEAVNEYDAGAFQDIDPAITGHGFCNPSASLLQIFANCEWFYKRFYTNAQSKAQLDAINKKLTPEQLPWDEFCYSDNTGTNNELIHRTEAEFWSITKEQGLGFPDLVFTIEDVPSFLHAKPAKRIQGVIETHHEGCDYGFEGWRINFEGNVRHCEAGWINGVLVTPKIQSKPVLKRHAQLTSSSTSSVSVSDIKDALALIARHIPDFDKTSSSSSSSSSNSDKLPKCAAVAGVYQVQLDNHEYGEDVEAFTPNPSHVDSNTCSNMIGYIEIHPNCDFATKFIRPHNFIPDLQFGIYQNDILCIDDAGGWDDRGVCAVETEYWEFTSRRHAGRYVEDGKFRFLVSTLAGQRLHPPTVLNGVASIGPVGAKCDYSIKGWKTKREQVTPCRDLISTPAPTPVPEP